MIYPTIHPATVYAARLADAVHGATTSIQDTAEKLRSSRAVFALEIAAMTGVAVTGVMAVGIWARAADARDRLSAMLGKK